MVTIENPDATFEGRAHVFGISIDDAESHRAFRANHSLPFPLLVDPENRVADAYGIDRIELDGGGQVYKRQTVVVGADGTVAKTMEAVDAASHAADALAAVGT